MKLVRKKVENGVEKDIIIGLIVSDRFIKEISPIIKNKHFKTNYVKIISKWCLEYYRQYGKAPYTDIQKIFKAKTKEKNVDEDNAELIEKFLININTKFSELESFNEQYLIDEAEKYLKKRDLEILAEDIDALLVNNKIEKAEQIISSYNRVEKLRNEYIDVLNDDKKVIRELLDEENEIFRFPGALGQMVGPICRADFVSFIAPMKRGKTHHLINFAVRASLLQLKVLFVSMEMPMKQLLTRFYQNFLGETRKPKNVEIPYFDEDNSLQMKTVERKGLKVSNAIKKMKKLEIMIKSGGLNLVCYPSRGTNIADLKNEINNLAHYKKFYPDVVIIDYLDILAPEPFSSRDVRHRIDETWSTARGLAQEINGIVVTASQGTRKTFQKDIDEEGVAEDIRKLAHVTHMIALNQSKEDKRSGIMRMAMLSAREEEFFTDDEVVVTYQYGIGKAYLDSRWKKDVIF